MKCWKCTFLCVLDLRLIGKRYLSYREEKNLGTLNLLFTNSPNNFFVCLQIVQITAALSEADMPTDCGRPDVIAYDLNGKISLESSYPW